MREKLNIKNGIGNPIRDGKSAGMHLFWKPGSELLSLIRIPYQIKCPIFELNNHAKINESFLELSFKTQMRRLTDTNTHTLYG
jgi:hypothetical protein